MLLNTRSYKCSNIIFWLKIFNWQVTRRIFWFSSWYEGNVGRLSFDWLKSKKNLKGFELIIQRISRKKSFHKVGWNNHWKNTKYYCFISISWVHKIKRNYCWKFLFQKYCSTYNSCKSYWFLKQTFISSQIWDYFLGKKKIIWILYLRSLEM